MANIETINAARAFYIPKTATKITSKIDNSVAYMYNDSMGRPSAMAFFGNQRKPFFRYYYNSVEKRNEKLTAFFEMITANKERKTEARASRSAPHSVKVGDMFYTSWGYEQTQVEFYQVVELVGKATVVIQELSAFTEKGNKGYDSDRVYAKKGSFASDKTIRKRVNMGSGSPSLKICDVITAWDWDGQSKHRSWYH